MIAGTQNNDDMTSTASVFDDFIETASSYAEDIEYRKRREEGQHLIELEELKDIKDQAKKKAKVELIKKGQNFKSHKRIVKPNVRRSITYRR